MRGGHDGSGKRAIVAAVSATIYQGQDTDRKERDMSNYAAHLLDDARKFIAYRRTVRSLNALDVNTRLDLDIHRSEIPNIAHRAVYGF